MQIFNLYSSVAITVQVCRLQVLFGSNLWQLYQKLNNNEALKVNKYVIMVINSLKTAAETNPEK